MKATRNCERDAAGRKSGTYPKELLGGAGLDRSVLDLCLFSEIFGGFDRRLHAFDGEEGGKVRRVGRDDNECKEPPDAADDTTGHRPASTNPAALEQGINSHNSIIVDKTIV